MTESLYEQVKPNLARICSIGNARKYDEKVKDSVNRSLLEDIKDGKSPEKKHITLDKFFK